MKIQCPKCKQAVPSDQVNMGTDLAFCPHCSEAFKISEAMDQDAISPDILKNPPKGAWFRKEMDRIVVGGSTRSPLAFFIVPFMCIWSGGSLGGIYGSQIIKGQFDPIQSLFGIPFILGSIIFWGIALMTICGKAEVSIGKVSSVFTGVGRLGWTRQFDWTEVRTIREEKMYIQYPGSRGAQIIMEGKTRIKFGMGLNEARRYFVLNVLKYLKTQTP